MYSASLPVKLGQVVTMLCTLFCLQTLAFFTFWKVIFSLHMSATRYTAKNKMSKRKAKSNSVSEFNKE